MGSVFLVFFSFPCAMSHVSLLCPFVIDPSVVSNINFLWFICTIKEIEFTTQIISIISLWTLLFLYVATFQQHRYMVYIYQLIRYFRACDSYHDFLSRGLQLTRKLIRNQGFIEVKLSYDFESFMVAAMTTSYVISVPHMTAHILYLS